MHATQSLEERYRLVMDRVAAAAARAGRGPDEVFVVAVTKYAELDDLLELVALGHRDFGESRVPQLVERAHAIEELLADGDAFEARLRAIRRARSLAGATGAGPGSGAGALGEGAGGIVGVTPDPAGADAGHGGVVGSPRAIGGIIGAIDPPTRVGERSARGESRRSADGTPSAAPAGPGRRATGGGIAGAGEGRQRAGAYPSPRWHMIGHLQRNKAKKCLEVTRLVHSVDSLRLIEEIHSLAYKKDREIEVLLQVNCSGESQKGGCAPAAAIHLAETIDSMIHLRLRGLMTMGPAGDDPDESRPAFAMCRELFDDIRARGIGEDRFNLLSMGMSGDFEIGIEHGANIVRIGSSIFGQRETGEDDAAGEGDGEGDDRARTGEGGIAG